MRSSFDFAPFRRSTVGFDRLFDLLETDQRGDGSEGYPPFDLSRRGEDSYRITLAVAGFRPEDIEVVAQQNQLTISGKRGERRTRSSISTAGSRLAPSNGASSLPTMSKSQIRRFRRMVCCGSICSASSPKAMKPRKIEIGGSSARQGSPRSPAGKTAKRPDRGHRLAADDGGEPC